MGPGGPQGRISAAAAFKSESRSYHAFVNGLISAPSSLLKGTSGRLFTITVLLDGLHALSLEEEAFARLQDSFVTVSASISNFTIHCF